MDMPNLTGQLLDPEAIAESKDLMGDKFGKLAGYFLEDSAMYVDQVEQALAKGESDALVAPAHTLKSSSRQMGAQRLSLLAEYIEHQARALVKENGDITTLATSITSLRSVLNETLAAYTTVVAA